MEELDLKKFDKNGNPLNLIKAGATKEQGFYYKRWLESGGTKFEPTAEDIKCELQLQALSAVEPLRFQFDMHLFNKEIAKYDGLWAPYLRREGTSNDREGLCLMGMPGDSYNDGLSMPEAQKRHGRKLDEVDFNSKTQLYHDLTSLHEMLDFFQPLGRTMLIKTNAGGWFPPHKDRPVLTRDCFRIAAFLSRSAASDSYEWHMDNQYWHFQPGTAYYIDTRKTHRTHSWANGSIHLIVNVPKTWENVIKLMSCTTV
jgi:hypothetical protein